MVVCLCHHVDLMLRSRRGDVGEIRPEFKVENADGGQGKVGHKGSANQAVLAQFPPLITVNARLSYKMISWSEVC